MPRITITWPNRITYTRILLVPVFLIAALQVRFHPACKYIAGGLFAAIAIGDAIDGYIAHKFNMSTLEGKFIDPLADKLLMITACVTLALPLWGIPGGGSPLRPEIAIIIISRDLLICTWVVVTVMAGAKLSIQPSRLGRLTTFIQMLMLGMMLLGTMADAVLRWVAIPLSYAAAALTIISGVHYLLRNTKKAAAQNKATE